ncbi:MAG: MurR/RpiR family transcriptional regulator, partial [Deltaproteobacteria bacterium]|nr:MurR/RpiR family transcriptional regulator [Deltaproteobacteria bacterium]
MTEKLRKLPKKRRMVVKYILDNPAQIAVLNVKDLAVKLSVDPATVVRAAQDMGFKGYHELKTSRKKDFRSNISAPYDIVLSGLKVESKIEDVIKRSMAADFDAFSSTISNVSVRVVEKVARAILKSNHTYIIGLGWASSLAGFLSRELRVIIPHVHEVLYYNAYLFNFMGHFTQKDVVLCIDFEKCTRQTLSAIREAKDKGCTT